MTTPTPRIPRIPRIMVALNGARRSQDQHPNLPITTQEIVSETVACAQAGADALHLHVRAADGRHSLDAGRYREALAALQRALPGFPVQITTEAAGIFSVAQQIDTVAGVRPSAVSISIREMARDPARAAHMYALCQDIGAQVQHILYTPEDTAQLLRWRDAGVVKADQSSVLFVLGAYQPPRTALPADVAPLLRAAPPALTERMVCAFGPSEHAVLIQAAQHGADLRVGFENNLHSPLGPLARSNAENVAALRAALPAALAEKESL
ncbi:3-keto-5-aminohexanoate cleavage protein [Thalassobius sp. S69A]|uniref:3-keto-5-aminohexanoate cleavage protein n=1 Tax=unclassified Thalassovita TaxID=2619711 RepID=UPI003C7A482A